MSGGTKFSEVLLRVLVATCALLVVVLVLDHPQHPIMQLFFAAGAIYVLAFCLPRIAVRQFYHRLLREVHEGALESIINCVENGLQVPPRSSQGQPLPDGGSE